MGRILAVFRTANIEALQKMSIIERVAEILGPIEQSQTDQPTSKSSRRTKLDSIERAVSESSAEHSAILEAGDRVALPKHAAHETTLEDELWLEGQTSGTPLKVIADDSSAAAQASGSSSVLRVDRDHLLRQGIIPPDGSRTAVAECIRLIKSQLLMNVGKKTEPGSPANVIMVTSSTPGEGKTFTAVNLAISIAQDRERSVLLVDADVAKPSIPLTIGVRAERGLMDVLDRGIDMAQVVCKLDIERLTFLPAGSPHPHATELLAGDRMSALVREMAEQYDDRIVIFDSPPLLAVSESNVLANHMGQIVVVVEAAKTPERVLLEALGRIDNSKVAGLVLNKVPGTRGKYGYGYGYSADA
jgi:receptor protein-tyrosine kinase